MIYDCFSLIIRQSSAAAFSWREPFKPPQRHREPGICSSSESISECASSGNRINEKQKKGVQSVPAAIRTKCESTKIDETDLNIIVSVRANCSTGACLVFPLLCSQQITGPEESAKEGLLSKAPMSQLQSNVAPC